MSNVLSFIGGLSKGIGILMLMCVIPVREILYYKQLINEMFSVCSNDDQIDLAFQIMMVNDTQSDDKLDGGGDGENGEVTIKEPANDKMLSVKHERSSRKHV